eukprot:1156564-Pelagomonas_calceolata.AAC.1
MEGAIHMMLFWERTYKASGLKLLTAYPHLCHKLGTIPKDELTYDNPQSWPSQEIALPQHTRDLQIIAVWNTAARVNLNNQNPTWIRDKKQIAKVPYKPVADITAPIPYQSKPNFQLKVANWKSWAYTDGSCQAQDSKTVIDAGVCHPVSGSENLVEPDGAGINSTIGRAELAAIAAALSHEHTHVATDSLSSLHQFRKQTLYPEKHRHHVQGDLGMNAQIKIAKYQASLKNNNLTDTGIPSAGPGGNPFYNIAWLAREEARPTTPELSPPPHFKFDIPSRP